MRLTTFFAATLPLLVTAVPSSVFDDRKQGADTLSDDPSQQDDRETSPGRFDFRAGQQPPATTSDYRTVAVDEGDAHKLEDSANLKLRDLEIRDDKDHYMQECDSEERNRKCITNLVIKKGSSKGGCTKRIQTEAADGTLHIVDRNVMCRYYEGKNCDGEMSGPYASGLVDYDFGSYLLWKIIWNPQSYQCQLIGFQAPNLPLPSPKAAGPNAMYPAIDDPDFE